jgi:hypothetical protein
VLKAVEKWGVRGKGVRERNGRINQCKVYPQWGFIEKLL